jgi:hypothetical protein
VERRRLSRFEEPPALSAARCTDSSPDLDLLDSCGGPTRGSFSEAKARIIAYWTDECARDLDRLMTHFTSNAAVTTPDGTYRGHAAVSALYKKSFDDFPGLTVDVTAAFAGKESHCFEYSAVLLDKADIRWLVEGINLMELERGLISSLRSFEDVPRRLSADPTPRRRTADFRLE